MPRAFFESVQMALVALRNNKLRSFLTMLGVIIGVFSIIVLIGIGQGVKQDVTREVTDLGANVVFVLPGQIQTEQGGFNPTASVGASTLTDEDVAALRALPVIQEATVISLLAGLPTAGDRKDPTAFTLAVEPGYFSILNSANLIAGRVISEEDVAQKARVAVLDSGPRKALFPDLQPEEVLGKAVRFGGEEYTVIGLLETPPSSSFIGGSQTASSLLVPYESAKEHIENAQIFRIVLRADPNAAIDEIVVTVQDTLFALHKQTQDFSVLTQEDLLDLIDSILSILTAAVAGISSISLLVGGIGIMNIMLVSVTERTKEIGLRKAIGASNANILFQFLVEAVILSLLGGIIGLALAYALSFPVKAQVGLTILINAQAAGLAIAFAFIIGVLFGIAPAIRAAKLNPIDALRYE